jgi:glutamate dehydrogenase
MLSIAQKRSVDSLENYRALIREMHRLGYLDRARDFLPGDEEIDERITLQAGLTRPELAFCSAAVKMWIKEDLCSSILCRDQSLNDILMGYFPAVVRERFPEAVSSHPLRAEIIASELANEVVSAVDIPFIFSATTATGQSASAVIAAVLAADRILGLPHLRSELQRYDTPQNASLFQELWTACGETLRKASLWLLNVHGTALSITTLASLYGPGFEALAQENVPQTGSTIEGLSSRDSARLRLLSDVIPTLEILWTAHEYKGSPAEIARVFNAVVSTINIVALLSAEHSLRPSNRWEQELIRGSFQEIRRTISTISGQLFTKGITSADAIARHLNSANGFTPLKTTITEITQRMTSAAPFEIAALPVIARQLRAVVV